MHSFTILFLALLVTSLHAVGMPTLAQDAPDQAALLEALEFRNIGPYRGGRATAVAGVPSGST